MTFFLVPARSWATDKRIFQKSVKSSFIVLTDCGKAYDELGLLGYNHRTVKHSKFYKDPKLGVRINTTKGNWASFKKFLPPICMNLKNPEGYL